MQHVGFQWQCKVRGLVPALRFNNSLEGLMEFTESFILMVTVYCRERVYIKFSHEKRCMGEIEESSKHRADNCTLLVESGEPHSPSRDV